MNNHEQTLRSRRVALLTPQQNAFFERILGGVVAYARNHGGWTFARSADVVPNLAAWLKGWDGDGALVLVNDRREEAELRALPFPVVNLSGHIGGLRLPTVMVDHFAIGKLAAQHLLERGFRRFGYVGVDGPWFSAQRRDGFISEIHRYGGSCDVFELPISHDAAMGWREEHERLEVWLRAQRPPLGVLACNDARASILLDTCDRIGWLSPEEVAVVGVDNAALTCESSMPTITSVSRNDYQVGQAAAALLDQLMNGGAPPDVPVLIQPDGVVARHSTETTAIDDPLVAAGVRWIREHIHQPFSVTELVAYLGKSRRRIEGLFLDALGESPYQTVCRLRIEHAKRLLRLSDNCSLVAIAQASGMPDQRRFRAVFTRIVGQSPAAFRKQLANHSLTVFKQAGQ